MDIIPNGTRCRIREWNDMAEKYGVDESGDILVDEVWFVEDMKPLCGKPFTVRKSEQFLDEGVTYYSAEEPEFEDWFICGGMLEVAEEEPEEQEAADEDVMLLLFR